MQKVSRLRAESSRRAAGNYFSDRFAEKPISAPLSAAGSSSSTIDRCSSFAGINGESPVLLRTKYCIRYELGMCPKYQGARPPQELFLLNNGRRLALHFDCAACEMSVTSA